MVSGCAEPQLLLRLRTSCNGSHVMSKIATQIIARVEHLIRIQTEHREKIRTKILRGQWCRDLEKETILHSCRMGNFLFGSLFVQKGSPHHFQVLTTNPLFVTYTNSRAFENLSNFPNSNSVVLSLLKTKEQLETILNFYVWIYARKHLERNIEVHSIWLTIGMTKPTKERTDEEKVMQTLHTFRDSRSPELQHTNLNKGNACLCLSMTILTVF